MKRQQHSVTVRKKKLKDGSHSLYLDIYNNGKRQYKFLGLYLTGNKSADSAVMATAHQAAADHIPAVVHLHDYTVFRLWDYVKRKNTTDKFALAAFRTFRNNNDLLVRAMTQSIAQAFLAYMIAKYKPSTVQGFTAYFNRIMKIAKDEGMISQSIVIKPPKSEQRTIIKYLTPEQLTTLYNTPFDTSPVTRRMFLFAAMTGLRLSDVLKLSPDDINKSAKTCRVVQKKTKAPVEIPLNDVALEMLEPYHTPSKVFQPIAESSLWLNLNRWAALAGIGMQLSFHVARHTFATMIYAGTKDLLLTKELLGHNNIASTMIYTKIATQQKIDAVANLPEINKKGQ